VPKKDRIHACGVSITFDAAMAIGGHIIKPSQLVVNLHIPVFFTGIPIKIFKKSNLHWQIQVG
jgi:hypothetical protein